MNRIGRSGRILGMLRSLPLTAALAGMGLAVIGLTVTGCGGGGSPAVSAPPSSGDTSAETAATMNWLEKTSEMWTNSDFSSLDQITTGQMRTIYDFEAKGAALPTNATRQPFQLTGLSITVPCHTGRPDVFVAYGDTDVFDLWSGMQPVAMVFEQVDGLWKLATAVDRPSGGWPALCRQGTPPAAPAALAPGDYAPALARVLTRAATGTAETTTAASPFAVNDFFAGSGSIPETSASSIRQDRPAGVSFTSRFTTTPDPSFALPLAGGRGFWLIAIMTQSNTYTAPGGFRAKDWPDGSQVATPRPAAVHHETDTFITTYAAIDPLRAANAAVVLDGFFGWPLASVAS
jgi:hypothetical protein